MRSELGGTIYNNIHSNNATYQAINGTLGFLNNISNLYYEDEVIKNNERQLLSDHYLEKANFLRMDYLNVGRKFDKMSVALTVSNVFVLTKYKGLDPEIGGGIDNNSYPRPRMYSLNFTFNF
jgi:iron complex outermembrane receptor protein